MTDVALVRYKNIDQILSDCALLTHKNMVREAYRIGFISGSIHKKDNQSIIIDFIRSYENRNGVSPTLDEIRMAGGWKSITSVQRALVSLEKQGLLTRDKYQKRCWSTTPTRKE